MQALGVVVGVGRCAGDGLAVCLQGRRQLLDGQRALADRGGHGRPGLAAENLRRDGSGLSGVSRFLDGLEVLLDPVLCADPLLGQRGHALFHSSEDLAGVDAGLVELSDQGGRFLEAVPHFLKLRPEGLHRCHEISEAGAGALRDLEHIVHGVAHVVGVNIPLLEGFARSLNDAAEIFAQQVRDLNGLPGYALQCVAGEAEPGVVVRDRLAGVLHCGRNR